jgi:hypothetical protein
MSAVITEAIDRIDEAIGHLADMHSRDRSCRFMGAETDDVGCLSCMAQWALTEALLLLRNGQDEARKQGAGEGEANG